MQPLRRHSEQLPTYVNAYTVVLHCSHVARRAHDVMGVVRSTSTHSTKLRTRNIGIVYWVSPFFDEADACLAGMVADKQASRRVALVRRSFAFIQVRNATTLPLERPNFMLHNFLEYVIQLSGSGCTSSLENFSWDGFRPNSFTICKFLNASTEILTRGVEVVVSARAINWTCFHAIIRSEISC